MCGSQWLVTQKTESFCQGKTLLIFFPYIKDSSLILRIGYHYLNILNVGQYLILFWIQISELGGVKVPQNEQPWNRY